MSDVYAPGQTRTNVPRYHAYDSGQISLRPQHFQEDNLNLEEHQAQTCDTLKPRPLTVTYRTPGGRNFTGRSPRLGAEAMFIETEPPLPVGTHLELEFVLPEQPQAQTTAIGVVALVCTNSDEFTHSPGIGARYRELRETINGYRLTTTAT